MLFYTHYRIIIINDVLKYILSTTTTTTTSKSVRFTGDTQVEKQKLFQCHGKGGRGKA